MCFGATWRADFGGSWKRRANIQKAAFCSELTTSFASRQKFLYAEGTKFTETPGDWNTDRVVRGDPALNATRIQKAVAPARKSDIVILVLAKIKIPAEVTRQFPSS